jgi:SAM-dependent methyltransferase
MLFRNASVTHHGDDRMTQNIYDDAGFFAGYSALPRSVHGLDGAPEWPALRALLPDLNGLRVLDLGCGFGWFCRFARGAGAASVAGYDVSERMLARARAETSDRAISYARADLEHLTLTPGSHDLAYSALALHYIENLDRLLAQVHATLISGARFIFSVEHPIYTAPHKPGWVTDAQGRRTWPLDAYHDEGPRSTDWLAEGVIKQHRTIATYFGLLRDAGFSVSHVDEWAPTHEQVAAHPDWALERERPPFLIMACSRN